MYATFHRNAEVGMFVKFVGHLVNEKYRADWWKVTEIDDTVIHVVNRHGNRCMFPLNSYGVKIHVWEKGDPRQ